ncbi:MAG: glycosyltransferase family 2 protein [Alphaproteobacteria bacterium]
MAAPTDNSIDVIIPTRGPVPWLTIALHSLAAQTLQPTWITVIDDGLESPAMVRNLGSQLFSARFQFLNNPGRGISAALNAAVKQSRACWIARMDADDVAHPNRLERQLGFLTAYSASTLGCGTQVRFINTLGKPLGHSRLFTSWEEIVGRIRSQTCFIHSSLMIQRQALVATPYRTSMDGAEDVDLILRLVEKGRIVNLDEPLLDYRLHSTQESFRDRARATAIQELAFRLALSRQKKNVDPLDQAGDLAERFIRWRLSDPAYIRARTFLTALRYAKTYLAGVDIDGSIQMALMSLKSFPTTWSSLNIAWQVARRAGAALLSQTTPFVELNAP